MSHNKMLIDASHPEETRVVVLRNGRVEEFDYESAARKLLRGSIYLAKVTRVEPSLQAAFVDYGGNRHGFLAFSEIHPDYYQIPIADRQQLIDEEAAAEAAEEAEADARAEAAERRRMNRGNRRDDGRGPEADEGGDAEHAEAAAIDVVEYLPPELGPEGPDEGPYEVHEKGPDERQEGEKAAAAPEAHGDTSAAGTDKPAARAVEEAAGLASADDVVREAVPETLTSEADRAPHDHAAFEVADRAVADAAEQVPLASADTADFSDAPVAIGNVEEIGVEEVETPETVGNVALQQVESAASEDAMEEVPSRPRRRARSYKIQEVIKRRQVILVQVVKEERGTKGAALTTYLSLAGRYTVLMPNTARGGGISRKITNAQDRKRLKAIAEELEVPEGMGLIIRTAGAARTKQEIKRDFEYLLRLWESVRDLTLRSTAPSLVYEEGDLIKRSIRDLYSKEVDEIVVSGEAAFKDARDFMRMLMPSHVKNVIKFEDPEPLFTRFQIERQLGAMFSPYVHLRSGGYLVINQTEALVAIDVNSGKSTREFSIEETALQTNLEAADEIARQLKLRDLAGLIVIDFIDMEENRNNRAVERRLKDALRFDRARIQVGRISHFGLMEMSRQRLRTGVLEGSTTQCPHCQGTGIIRSTESVALAVLRGIEDALMNATPQALTATTTTQVALYLLNNKRVFINEIEARTGCAITIAASEKVQGANFTVERSARSAEPQRRVERSAVKMDWGFDETDAVPEAEPEVESEVEELGPRENGEQSREGGRRRRRRRGRRGDRPERGDRMDRPSMMGGGEQPADFADDSEGLPPETHAADTSRPHADEQPEDDIGAVEEIEGENGPEEGERPARAEGEDGGRRRGRRRGRRGGRRGRDRDDAPSAVNGNGAAHFDEDREPAAVGTQDEAHQVEVASDGTRHPASNGAPAGAPAMTSGAEVAYAVEAPIVVPEPQPVVPAAVAPAPVAEAREPAVNGAIANGEHRTPEPAAAPEMTPQPDPRASRTDPVATEPVVARIVVGDGGASEEAAKPVRRGGWWRR